MLLSCANLQYAALDCARLLQQEILVFYTVYLWGNKNVGLFTVQGSHTDKDRPFTTVVVALIADIYFALIETLGWLCRLKSSQ